MSGFGKTTVYGRKRVPIPPARTTARLDIVEGPFVTTQVVRVLKPVDRPSESLPQWDLRSKSRSVSKLPAIAAKPLHFTFGGAKSFRVNFDLGIAGHDLRDQQEKFAHRDLLVR